MCNIIRMTSGGPYTPDNVTNGSANLVEELSRSNVKGLFRVVEPTAIQPLKQRHEEGKSHTTVHTHIV